MYLSSGALRLLSILRWFRDRCGDIFPKQKYLAAKLNAHARHAGPVECCRSCLRSVSRWARELREAGILQTARRGRLGCLYSLVDKPVEKQGELFPIVVSSVVSSVVLSHPAPLYEYSDGSEARKPPKYSRFIGPPQTLRNALGRVDRNPEAVRVAEVVRGVVRRAQSAADPARYELAALAREFPRSAFPDWWAVA